MTWFRKKVMYRQYLYVIYLSFSPKQEAFTCNQIHQQSVKLKYTPDKDDNEIIYFIYFQLSINFVTICKYKYILHTCSSFIYKGQLFDSSQGGINYLFSLPGISYRCHIDIDALVSRLSYGQDGDKSYINNEFI